MDPSSTATAADDGRAAAPNSTPSQQPEAGPSAGPLQAHSQAQLRNQQQAQHHQSEHAFSESLPTFRMDGPSRRHERDRDEDDDDDDDDEALLAELDREVEAMDDEQNYDRSQRPPSQQAGSGQWIGRGAFDADGLDRNGAGTRQDDAPWEAGFDMAEFRERRLQEIREELSRRKEGTSQSQNSSSYALRGKLTEVTHEKELIHLSSQESSVAIHFFHQDFERCRLLDRHLEVLARLHPDTLFLRANVLNCPFLTQKLGIKVLPCIITFKDGISKDKLVGFEELGNSDRFSTGALEWRLGQSGIIDPRRNQKPILGFAEGTSQSVGAGVVGASRGRKKDRNGRPLDDDDDDEDGDYWHDD